VKNSQKIKNFADYISMSRYLFHRPNGFSVFRRLEDYFSGWATISLAGWLFLQADCLFFTAWVAFSPRLIGLTIFGLIHPLISTDPYFRLAFRAQRADLCRK